MGQLRQSHHGARDTTDDCEDDKRWRIGWTDVDRPGEAQGPGGRVGVKELARAQTIMARGYRFPINEPNIRGREKVSGTFF